MAWLTTSIGDQFEDLTVISDWYSIDGARYTDVKCKCGKQLSRRLSDLNNGKSKRCASCACKKRYGDFPRDANNPTYRSWQAMRTRCNNPNRKAYKDYGGRGITVCERWDSYKNFVEDMGERPEGKTLDRMDNDGNYEPDNCRWATRQEQSENTRRTRLIEYTGKSQSLRTWCRELDLNYKAIWNRLYQQKWSVKRAFETPIQPLGTNQFSVNRTG